MDRQVRIGIIGMGSMGCGYGDMILKGKAPGLVLSAVTRIKKEKNAWAKENLPGETEVFPDGEALIKSKKTDAVLIATPHYSHPILALEAFKEGLHVLCDKPAGVYALPVKEAVLEAKKRDLVYGMIFQKRMDPLYKTVRRMVQSGRYGSLKRVSWIITDWYRTESYYHSSPWRATWKGEGGGVLINQCPHNLDLLQWICGMPCRVQAFCHEGKWHSIQTEDDVTAYLEFPNGATGVFVASTGDAPGVNRLEIDLENAQILCENKTLRLYAMEGSEAQHRKTCKEHGKKPKGHWQEIRIGGEDPGHPGILKNFADAILYGVPLIAEGEEGLLSLALSNAMYLSSWQKQMVDLPLDDQVFFRALQEKAGEAY